jgi:hypothetical protein
MIADNWSGAKLLATLFVILLYSVAGRALFTGSILTRGIPGRIYRSERPLAYWYYVLFHASLATLVLLSVFFDYLAVHFGMVFLIWFGASAVAFAIVMTADRRMAGLPSFNAGLGPLPLWAHLLSVAALLLVMIGVIGFITPFVAASGGMIWFPNSYEWPVGSADRVIAMPNGYHVVPVDFMSRIQVYDQNWRFVRGWFFEGGGGGSVALLPTGQDQFEVFTGKLKFGGSRGSHYIFTLKGDLVWQGNSSLDEATWDSIVKRAKSVAVPTPPWLWPFSSPVHAWATALCGCLISAFIRIRRRWATAVKTPHSDSWIYIGTEQPQP